MVALSPERAIEIQNLLDSDIVMQLDECLELPAARAEIERAMRLSLRWAERCKRAFEGAAPGRALFGIVQGGDDAALRLESARGLVAMSLPGYAIGGLAVGEPQAVSPVDDQRPLQLGEPLRVEPARDGPLDERAQIICQRAGPGRRPCGLHLPPADDQNRDETDYP